MISGRKGSAQLRQSESSKEPKRRRLWTTTMLLSLLACGMLLRLFLWNPNTSSNLSLSGIGTDKKRYKENDGDGLRIRKQQIGSTNSRRRKPPPKFILGFSTGHTGTTTAHHVLQENDPSKCPYAPTTADFESIASGERFEDYDPVYPCNFTDSVVIPHLQRQLKNQQVHGDGGAGAFVDAGHFHNRGPVFECLAKSSIANDLAIIFIRRNRYHIARSFTRNRLTPCLRDATNDFDKSHHHPNIAYCPHSADGNGPAALSLPDDQWKRLTAFQKFLWMADDMEYRFHKLRQQGQTQSGSSAGRSEEVGPQYFSVTWTTGDEYEAGLLSIRAEFGCRRDDTNEDKVNNHNSHISHSILRNCTDEIQQDLEYRRIMKFNRDQLEVLYSRHPQRLDDGQCQEEADKSIPSLERLIESQSDITRLKEWVLPPSSMR